MSTSRFRSSSLAVPAIMAVAVSSWAPWSTPDVAPELASSSAPVVDEAQAKADAAEAYGDLPISFEANAGQSDPAVDFISRGHGYSLFLTPTEAVMSFSGPAPEADVSVPGGGDGAVSEAAAGVLRMRAVGANPDPAVLGQEERPGTANYFSGSEPSQWRQGVSTFGRVAYDEVYPGIDLAWHGTQGELEYDFVVEPGTDPSVIGLEFEGADDMRLDEEGNLLLGVGGQEVRQRKPVVYQDIDGTRAPVEGDFVVQGSQVGFAVGDYDPSQTLVIDPVVEYSTLLGGTGPDDPNTAGFPGDDEAFAIEVDAAGNSYVGGTTFSADFPTTAGALDTSCGTDGACNGSDDQFGPFGDVFVTKLDPSGSALVYSTFLGGSSFEGGSDLAIDVAGRAYVVGTTSSSDFPTTPDAFQSTDPAPSGDNSFVTKLDAAGGLGYSTYLGLSRRGVRANGVDVDASGRAYVVGGAEFDPSLEGEFPTTPGSFQEDCVISESFGQFFCSDAFLVIFDPSGSEVEYGTFLGGDGFGESLDRIVVDDDSGIATIVGSTRSNSFPTTPGAFDPVPGNGNVNNGDLVVVRIDPAGGGTSDLLYSSYLGGDNDSGDNEQASQVALGNVGGVDDAIYVSGTINQFGEDYNFPTTPGALQEESAGLIDAFLTVITPLGNGPSDLYYSTRIGGSNSDSASGVAVGPDGRAYVVGTATSLDFPRTTNEGQCTPGTSFEGDPTCTAPYVTIIDPDPTDANPGPFDEADLIFSDYIITGGFLTGGFLAAAERPTMELYLAGSTQRLDFPTTAGAFQEEAKGGKCNFGDCDDVFVTKITGFEEEGAGLCLGLALTITGTEAGETLVGTEADDVIAGLGGDDRIVGGGGHDVICGGEGNDTLDGRAGDDRLLGGGGDDRAIGGPGDDIASGDDGNDNLSGDAGHDNLFGGAGNDSLRGGAGNDGSVGDAGDDAVTDGTGDDLLDGGEGNDTLRGGAGDDSVVGGAGDDRLLGEAGADFLFGNEGANSFNGGSDVDTCLAGAGTGGSTGCETDASGRFISVALEGAQIPGGGGDPDATGSASIGLYPSLGSVCYFVSFAGVDGEVTSAHLHDAPAGEVGPHHVDLFDGVALASPGSTSGCVGAGIEAIEAVIDDPAGFYVNLHSTAFPAGAIRGQLE